MKWQALKDKKNIIIILLIVIIILIIIGFCLFIKLKFNNNKNDIILQDTTYNTVILDKIKHNIIIKDSIITKIKYKYETEIIKANNMSDSSSVELFKLLCSSDSLYRGNNSIR